MLNRTLCARADITLSMCIANVRSGKYGTRCTLDDSLGGATEHEMIQVCSAMCPKHNEVRRHIRRDSVDLFAWVAGPLLEFKSMHAAGRKFLLKVTELNLSVSLHVFKVYDARRVRAEAERAFGYMENMDLGFISLRKKGRIVLRLVRTFGKIRRIQNLSHQWRAHGVLVLAFMFRSLDPIEAVNLQAGWEGHILLESAPPVNRLAPAGRQMPSRLGS